MSKRDKVFVLIQSGNKTLYQTITGAKAGAAECGEIHPLTWIAEYKYGESRRAKMIYVGQHLWVAPSKKWVYREASYYL